jgi:hypothetical protein
MQLPGFLTRDPTDGPPSPDDRESGGHTALGCILGCLAGLFFWFVPIPVVIVVWAFGLEGPFGDKMLMAIPFFLALPIIGAGIADLLGRRRRARRCRR